MPAWLQRDWRVVLPVPAAPWTMSQRPRRRPPRSGRFIQITLVQNVAGHPRFFDRNLHPEVWVTASLGTVLHAALVVQRHERGLGDVAERYRALDVERGEWIANLELPLGNYPDLRSVAFVDRTLQAAYPTPRDLCVLLAAEVA